MDQRYTVISCDGHAGATYPEGGFLSYVDPAYRERLQAEMKRDADRMAKFIEKLFDQGFRGQQDETLAAQEGGRSGAWDPARRIAELEADGIVADVIFPDGSQQNGAPFLASAGPGAVGADPSLQAVGAWAYNRWLADFVAAHRGRHAGIALMTLHDVEEAVAQVRWAKQHDLRGVLLPAGVGALPFYHHPRYEPIWSVCEEVELPLHTHVGSATPDYGDLPGSTTLFATESMWFSHRPFWFLIWGGVFERYPRLRVVFAEQGADWVPDTLRLLDSMYLSMFRHEQKRLRLRPSEYWRRQCAVEAMFMGRREVEMRHAIGIENLVWGSDYPHYEGSWPNSMKCLHEALEGVPEPEIRAILSGNAARIYGFDLGQLDPIAARVGPEVATLGANRIGSALQPS
jgi:predicted TIM-barrel fold metal-dependent hydrolase